MKTFALIAGVLSLLGVHGGTAANLITNPDMSADDGIGQPIGWIAHQYPFEPDGGIEAGPLGDGVFVLSAKGRTSKYFWEQGGLTLVPGARYRLSYEVRNAELGGGQVDVFVRDREWEWQSKGGAVPQVTRGEWAVRSCEFTASATKHPSGYCLEIGVFVGKTGKVRAEFRRLRLEALDPVVAQSSHPMPAKQLVRLPARIVPVDPLLSRVDSSVGRLKFYYARADLNEGCVLSCGLTDGSGKTSEASFDRDGYAEVRLGKLKDGEHRIAVRVRSSDGRELAANEYRIVAGTWSDPSKIGKRLNNLVTELVSCPIKNTEFEFERAEDGWIWISIDDDAGDARGYLDGGPECVICRREGEDTIETQRFLRAGKHTLLIKGAVSGRLRIHAVKEIWGSRFKDFSKKVCNFERFGSYGFALPFLRKYGVVANYNTIGEGTGKARWDDFSGELGYYLGRGMRSARACMFSPFDPERLDAEATYRRIMRDVWSGFSAGTSIDENKLKASSLESVNFSEAIWRINDENPQNQFNLFYCDTSLGNTYDKPRQNVSEIAAVINSGNGHGLLAPELYMPVTPTRKEFGQYIDACAEFIASALRMVPASRRRTILYSASYIMINEWCNYYSPEADIKVQESDLLRAYATDPRFADCAGVGFGGIGFGNEEFLRWSMKLLRYYALEGGTEDLAEKYGYKWNPGFVKNPDFAEGFTNWTAQAAETGSLRAERIHQYGSVYQHRSGPPGCGDGVVTFVVSGKGTNRISQKVRGLTPGAYYSVQCSVTDRLPAASKQHSVKSVEEHQKMPFTFSVGLEGATEVRGLRINHPQQFARSVSESERKGAMAHVLRYVFRANAPEATLIFADGEPGGPATVEGRAYSFNYIIFTPYHCDGEADIREIEATIRGETEPVRFDLTPVVRKSLSEGKCVIDASLDALDALKAFEDSHPGRRVILDSSVPFVPDGSSSEWNVVRAIRRLADGKRIFWKSADDHRSFLNWTPDFGAESKVAPQTRYPDGRLGLREKRGEDYWWQTRLRQQMDCVRSRKGSKVDIVLVGDSNTHFLEGKWGDFARPWARYTSFTNRHSVVNLGIGGDRTEHALWRCRFGELDGYEAKYVSILIGANNGGPYHKKEDIVRAIGDIIAVVREKQPQATIILNALLAHGSAPDDPDEIKKREVNAEIRKFADGKRVVWLNFRDALCGPDGCMLERYRCDNAHLNGEGYTVWLDALEGLIGK